MLINWFRDQDHLVYINGETQLAQLEKTLRFPGLQEAAEALRDNPNPEGYTIKGPKRTCGRLFVPDLTFGKHIEMGENVFFYMGEMAECYVICYCPLYALGDRCGGNFRYIGDGIKDCSGCLLPHGRKSYGYVTGKFGEIAELAKKNRHTEE